MGTSKEKQDILPTLEVPTQIGTGLESKNYLGTILVMGHQAWSLYFILHDVF